MFPAMVCSEPLSSLSPQWKWNCLNLYVPVMGPPVIATYIHTQFQSQLIVVTSSKLNLFLVCDLVPS